MIVLLQFECARGFAMSQVDGVGFAVGPPAPARFVIGLAEAEIENRLKVKMGRYIVSLSVPICCLVNLMLATRRQHRKSSGYI